MTGTLFPRVLALAVLAAAIAPAGRAQSTDPVSALAGVAPAATIPQVDVTLTPSYRRVMDGGDYLGQAALLLHTSVRLGRNASLALVSRSVSVEGTRAPGLSTLGDTYAQASYGGSVGGGSFIASLGVNLPSGKRELDAEAFRTSVLLSQSFYDFDVPVLGQGFNVAPGLTWALPVTERVVVGLGVAYQMRGGFTPSEDLGDAYDPGDEAVLTAGFDVRVGEVSALSIDVTATRYGDDAFGEGVAYGAGTSVSGTVQLLAVQGFNTWRLVGHYQRRARTDFPFLDATSGALRTVPDRALVRATYDVRTGERRRLALHAQARHFSAVDLINDDVESGAQLLFDAGVAPVYEVTPALHLISRFEFTLGPFTAVEAALGLRFLR